MLLTRLKLRNWRNFPKADIALGRRTFVYGPNAAGKTNFLDVFRFLRDVAREEGGLQWAVRERNGFSALRSLHAHGTHQQIEIEVTCELDDSEWVYSLALDQDGKTQRAKVRSESVHRDGEALDKRPSSDDKKDPARLRETHLESLRSNQKFRQLTEAFAAFDYMHLVPHVVKYPSAAPANDTSLEMGARLLEHIARTPKKRRDSLLKKVNRALKIALPQFEDLQFEKDPVTGAPHLKARYIHWRPQGGWQREDQFSDGTLRLLGLLWKLADSGDVLLLEEPELSLHTELVRQLPRVLARATAHKQVIFSSHSTEILEDSGVDPSEIVLLLPGKNGTEVHLGSEHEDLVAVAENDGNLAPIVAGITRPKGAEQLSLYGK